MTQLKFQPSDVPDGGMKTFEIGEQKVLITRDGNDCRAYDALCPHAGADLGQGVRCGVRVICPWHHATFHAASGALIEPPALEELKRYAVRQEGESYTVDLDAEVPTSPPEPVGNDTDHTVIVGGGAAGFMVAQTLRAGGYAGRITLLTREARAPYDRTALSKAYLSGKKPSDKLALGGPEWAQEHQIDLRENVLAERLDRQTKTLHLSGGETLNYDQVLVATGGTPNTLKVPGAELEGVYPLRSFKEAEALKTAAQGKHLVIIGASFIGLEAASSLVGEGGAASVTVVGQDAEVLTKAVTARVGRALRSLHEDKGVVFHLNAEVVRLDGQGRVEAVILKDGKRLDADVVLLGIGVKPNAALLADLADEKGAVSVDGTLHAAPDVYALGDIALAPSVLGNFRVEHWRVALQHGMAAAQHILQSPDQEPTSARVPFFWTQQYGKSLRSVGHAEKLDDTHVWGEPENLKFIEFAFEDGRTVAASGMGRDAELAAFDELLRQGRAPTPAELRAGEFGLAERLE
ncbi:FAD-dependent oxidoreductase [Deinococcus sp.]|uniref:FAD-dependent oxidoreductase n=1 Tax=Deinococcus sp. TaxID=47478 RepID=UPI003B59D926